MGWVGREKGFVPDRDRESERVFQGSRANCSAAADDRTVIAIWVCAGERMDSRRDRRVSPERSGDDDQRRDVAVAMKTRTRALSVCTLSRVVCV